MRQDDFNNEEVLETTLPAGIDAGQLNALFAPLYKNLLEHQAKRERAEERKRRRAECALLKVRRC
jgi:hypothetical protein